MGSDALKNHASSGDHGEAAILDLLQLMGGKAGREGGREEGREGLVHRVFRNMIGAWKKK